MFNVECSTFAFPPPKKVPPLPGDKQEGGAGLDSGPTPNPLFRRHNYLFAISTLSVFTQVKTDHFVFFAHAEETSGLEDREQDEHGDEGVDRNHK